MDKAPDNLYIVIPAGGVGTRLWPRSRQTDPKQFLLLSEGKSITQNTFSRLEGFIPYERIFVIAEDRYKQKLFEQLPKFLPENFISEPERRGTSAAIGLAALFVKRKNPQGVVHFLVSDDYIKDIPRFRRMITVAAKIADKEKTLVAYGVKPKYPATGYGYIQFEKGNRKIDNIEIYKVKRFIEKPDEKTAVKFFSSGDYFWHGSGFTTRCDILLNEMENNWSEGFKILGEIEKLAFLPSDIEEGRVLQFYRQLENIAIEYSILEKAEKIMMVRLEDTWRDIASWKVIYEVSEKDKDGNVVIKKGDKDLAISLESRNNLIHCDNQLIALIGVEDLIVVDTGDAVLVCKKDKAEDVKKIVEQLKQEGKTEYL